jgi:hypothetical protein
MADEWLQRAIAAGLQDARVEEVGGRQLTRIDGTVRGRSISLARETDGDVVYSVVRAPIEPPLDLGLDTRPGSLARMPHHLHGVGHVHLDQEYALSVDDIARARALFDSALADRVYELHCACASPTITDASVALVSDWSRPVVEGAVDLVELVDAARARIPVPAPLSAHVSAWTLLARRIGAVVRLTPLRVAGTFEHLALQATAVRIGRARHRLELALRLPAPLGAELHLAPTRSLIDWASVLLGGQDVRVGDATFDEAYRIRVGADHEPALARALDQGTRALLLGARAHGAEVVLDDQGVRAVFDAAVQPDALPAAVEPLAEATRRIERALRARGQRESPYRA